MNTYSKKLTGLIWITGMAGSGKTTFSKKLAQFLERSLQVRPLLLDGDALRSALQSSNRYTPDERLELAHAYSALSQLFVSQGFCVICATVSMFDSVRKANRTQNTHYCEIFLDVDDEIRISRKQIPSLSKQEVVTSALFQLPQSSDFHFQNPTSEDLNQACHDVTSFLLTHWQERT